MKVLVIDDDQDRISQFIDNNPDCEIHYATDLKGAFSFFDNLDRYDVICLDHDLGVDETTIPFVWKIVETYNGNDVCFQILVHSANPVGAANILSYFSRTDIVCSKMHFPWKIKNLFKVVY